MQPRKLILKKFRRCRFGGTAVEFALLAPVLIMMLMGSVAYGGYFWTAHAVQQIANDAARSAVAGMNAAERADLVRTTLDREISDYAYLESPKAAVLVREAADRCSITVNYDASTSVFFALKGLVPMPPPLIARQATVLLGGY